MPILSRRLVFSAIAGLLLSGTAAATSAAPGAGFVAHYQVSQGGQPLGTATLTLQPGPDGVYSYTSQIDGSGGMAALLAASVNELSQFRWVNGAPQTVHYQYRLKSSLKTRQRQLDVDPHSGQVSVDEGKGVEHYQAQANMVDHNLLVPTIGWALQKSHGASLSVPVAVRQAVETQNFAVSHDAAVTVPAGTFPTERVDRSDQGKAFSAWYAPSRYPVPVKLSEDEGGGIVMQLIDFKAK